MDRIEESRWNKTFGWHRIGDSVSRFSTSLYTSVKCTIDAIFILSNFHGRKHSMKLNVLPRLWHRWRHERCLSRCLIGSICNFRWRFKVNPPHRTSWRIWIIPWWCANIANIIMFQSGLSVASVMLLWCCCCYLKFMLAPTTKPFLVTTACSLAICRMMPSNKFRYGAYDNADSWIHGHHAAKCVAEGMVAFCCWCCCQLPCTTSLASTAP